MLYNACHNFAADLIWEINPKTEQTILDDLSSVKSIADEVYGISLSILADYRELGLTEVRLVETLDYVSTVHATPLKTFNKQEFITRVRTLVELISPNAGIKKSTPAAKFVLHVKDTVESCLY